MPRNVKAPVHGATGALGVHLAAEHHQNRRRLSRAQAVDRAREYAQAARSNMEAGIELGGRGGFALISLAHRFAQQAASLRVLAGGLS